ncbi:hypothetical protein KY290_020752 [Solanum tuberosum]|uniref:Protein kinase domain-containing protein n=1 Tax=Solanum tuberosum TaxID=4113 RepID=A0ABQ7UZJ0_SOLTU|nr:hypothetical protein KY290_020752 [Solanum tuberosum]
MRLFALGSVSRAVQKGNGELNLENNLFHGGIPYGLGHLPRLRVIDVKNNQLNGKLHLTDNELEGEIPPHITNASKLENLRLAHNFFSGSIPTHWGSLPDLRLLFLHENQLTSEHELPFFKSLADCRMLQYLDVGYNPLNSILPNSIGNLSSSIEFFEISDAHINGLIPASIGNMSGLTTLVFQDNNFTGNIPPEFGKLKQLQGLYLNNNKLKGHVPEAVCNLSNLGRLYLQGNELFEGEVPSDIGELKAIVELDISGNHFSGMIPSNLGDLQNLQSLALSNNSFSGQIPLSFANLISLQFLDLSLNALSGTIPKSLEKLPLKNINVSFNELEGEIPSGGVFSNSTLQSFLGNRGLCGAHILEIPACVVTNPGQQSNLKEVVVKIVTPVIISSFVILLLVSIWIMKWQKKGKSKDVEKVPEIKTFQLISYHEIQRATNNFDVSNLIGVGGSSSVYKGTLFSGVVVAIKVLDLENEHVCKRFDTECEVIRNVRHRNLVSVITTCSSDHIRAFVLQFMSNGSLDNWLYREDRHLNLLQRITVMLDVAMAIEYLHHGHDTPIVHCDLKPANVFLGEDMVARVGDFGISKILAVSKSVAHTETLGTLGYIAPEYGSEGIVSASGDVYSYGIMLMEVLAKRRPTDEEIFNENLGLREWIRRAFPNTMLKVVDANLFPEREQITSKSEICIASMIELALHCTKETPESRITMKDVVKRLNKIKNAFWEM